MPDEQPIIHGSVFRAPETVEYQPAEDGDQWFDEPQEPPRRPRRRLLTPLPITIIAVLLLAVGFIVGVQVEKGQTNESSGTAGIAAGIAALRGGSSNAATGKSAGTSAVGAGFPGAGAAGGLTSGTVADVSGSTLYVTTSEGNTLRVSTSAGTSVSKSSKVEVGSIRPGESVTITGSTGSDGVVNAKSITVGSTAGSLFGGLGGSGAGSTSSSTGAGTSALFGSG
jgi:hypothetical protein